MAAAPVLPLRRPPVQVQVNLFTGLPEALPPEQLDFEFPDSGDTLLPDDDSVILLSTENGSQLFVSGFGLYLGKKSERLVVKKGGVVCAQVTLMKLQEVIITSRGISLSSDLIETLCSRGIRLAFLTASGKPNALLTSPLLTATVETRRAQLEAFHTPRGADLCRWIVAGKLRNQEKMLRYFAKNRPLPARESLLTAAAQIRQMRGKARITPGDSPAEVRGALLGLEGTAGRIYWQQLSRLLPDSSDFASRSHRGPSDAVNAALNYGYGILYSHTWGAVMNAGLEPFAGFLHTDRSGKPSLVLDLVEEFRQPVVDRPLFGWLNKGGSLQLSKGMLDAASREEVASRVLMRLTSTETYRGKQHQIRSIIQMQARLAASSFRGLRAYRPFTFRW